MYNNRSNYNSNNTSRRQSARYNTPGKFVPAAQTQDEQQPPPPPSLAANPAPPAQSVPAASRQYTPAPAPAPAPQNAPPQNPPPQNPLSQLHKEEPQSSNSSDWQNSSLDYSLENEEQNMSTEGIDGEVKEKKFWMKVMKGGVKKVSNKERRRRQNETLRRLLTPKNALMVLNETLPPEQGNHVFQVEATGADSGYYLGTKGVLQFCAELNLEGQQYRGYGENKAAARTNAAEQAFRDVVIRKMKNSALNNMETDDAEVGTGTESAAGEEPPLPMMQLASYALHKLFTEWQAEGYQVPLLRSPAHAQTDHLDDSDAASVASHKPPKAQKPRQLPANAADMHPAMLLSYMRSGLVYHDVAVEGSKPHNVTFTVGVVVDGQTFLGKASNKKEARKIAARAACQNLFGVVFNPQAQINAKPSDAATAALPNPPAGQWGSTV